MSREALFIAVRKCVDILDDSLSQTEGDTQSPAAQALELFKAFLAEMEKIDAQAHTGTGSSRSLLLHLCMLIIPCHCQRKRRREREG